MTDDYPAPSEIKVRGTDSNTLLRMYDAARQASKESPSQGVRERAAKAVERIARELLRLGVRL